MDIHRNARISKWISIKAWIIEYWYPLKHAISTHGYLLFMDIHCIMFLCGYPCLDINMDIHTCMDNWRLTSKNHGYPCRYPRIFGNPGMDMQWIFGPGFGGKSNHRLESKIWLPFGRNLPKPAESLNDEHMESRWNLSREAFAGERRRRRRCAATHRCCMRALMRKSLAPGKPLALYAALQNAWRKGLRRPHGAWRWDEASRASTRGPCTKSMRDARPARRNFNPFWDCRRRGAAMLRQMAHICNLVLNPAVSFALLSSSWGWNFDPRKTLGSPSPRWKRLRQDACCKLDRTLFARISTENLFLGPFFVSYMKSYFGLASLKKKWHTCPIHHLHSIGHIWHIHKSYMDKYTWP